MKQTDSDYIVIGKIGSTYGIKGWLKIISFTDPISNISQYNPWYIEHANGWEPVKVNGSREHGKNMIAKLYGQNNPEDARLLTGKKIAIKRSQLPSLKQDEYYWEDLEGLTVIDLQGQTLGTVIFLLATGSNDVLVVKGKKEHAIPFLLNDVIKRVDLEAKQIHVDWEEL